MLTLPDTKNVKSQVENSIELQIKKNTEIKPFDIDNVEDWINEQISFIPSEKTSLQHCYEAYKNYLE